MTENPTRAIALVRDMIFAARIRGAADAAGVRVETTSSADRLIQRATEAGPALVLVDLDARAAAPVESIRRLKEEEATRRIHVVAFGSHVETAALAAARAAGADRVLARSAFVRELPRMLAPETGEDAS